VDVTIDLRLLVLMAVGFFFAGMWTGSYIVPPAYDLLCRIRRGLGG